MLATPFGQHEIAPIDAGRAGDPAIGSRASRERRLRAAIEVLRGMDDERAAPGLRRAVGDLEQRLRGLDPVPQLPARSRSPHQGAADDPPAAGRP